MSKKGEANQQVDGLLNNVSIHLLVFFKAELKKGLQGLQGWECYMRITQVGKLSVVP